MTRATPPAGPTGRPLHIVVLDYRDRAHPQAGGAEVYVDEIFQRVAAAGHRVTLVAGRFRGAAPEAMQGRIRVHRVGTTATMNVAGARHALALARREPVDVFVESICKLPFLLPALTRRPVLPVVHHLFGATIFYQLNPAAAAYAWLYERLIPRCYRGLRVVTVSPSTTRDLQRRGLAARAFDVVYNGVDPERFRLDGGPAPPREPLLVYVGRLRRYKQIDIALRAFALARRRVPGARLALVGRGDDQERLERLARRLGIADAVAFTGFVPEAEKVRWLHRAAALVYPSPREGWGISTLEAAACGTPVVASDSDGLRDAVRHGETGFLVPHRDAAAWADRMVALLTDAALRDRLGAAGREWARRFTWDGQAARMQGIIEELAGTWAGAVPAGHPGAAGPPERAAAA